MKAKHKWYTMKEMGSLRRIKEQGMVSIVVTMIVLVVLTLITVGFATLTRREQRQSLDKQLSSQAFYAAESGINDVTKLLPGGTVAQKTACQGPDTNGNFPAGAFYTVSGNVTISCLLIDTQPTTLQYKAVNPLTSIYTPIESATGASIDHLHIEWSDTTPTHTFDPGTAPPNWPTQVAWGATVPALRIALTDTTAALDHNSLVNSTYTFYLYPQAGGGPGATPVGIPGLGAANQGSINVVNCNNTRPPAHQYCWADITIPAPSAKFFLRLTPIYQATPVILRIYSGGIQQNFSNGQAVIDATGKAQDVLRRIQVRQPLVPDNNYPEFAVESGSPICKLLDVTPSGATVDPAAGSPTPASCTP